MHQVCASVLKLRAAELNVDVIAAGCNGVLSADVVDVTLLVGDDDTARE
jgi:hypothetical protein